MVVPASLFREEMPATSVYPEIPAKLVPLPQNGAKVLINGVLIQERDSGFRPSVLARYFTDCCFSLRRHVFC